MTDATAKTPSPRRSVLDLAPLELDCMNTLWPMGEGTVREIRDQLAARRPRAYTTIMTIMDRLARKGVVERRKVGRAYTYRANVSADEARAQALGQVVENFFGGSKEALLAQLNGVLPAARLDATYPPAPRARAAAASSRAGSATSGANAISAPAPRSTASTPVNHAGESSGRDLHQEVHQEVRQDARRGNSPGTERIDDSLL
jgi:BlaI family transcriptional regulator, penicillinase repressor